MAKEVKLKLGIDSQPWEAGLKKAQQHLGNFIKAGGGLKNVMAQNSEAMRAAVAEFGNLESTAATARGKMRDYSNAISDLRMMYSQLTDEEKRSPFGLEMAKAMDKLIEKGGQVQDIMNDTQQAMRNAASDTRAFDQIAAGAQFAAASMQTMQGAMQMFGVENKNALQAMAKLQAAMAVTNGLTQLQTLLQKQSALMQGVATLQTKALAAAKALEAKNTASATAAQKAFNLVAKMNPYALLAAGVVAAAGALSLFGGSADEAADSADEAASKVGTLENAMKNAEAAAGESVARLNYLNNAMRDSTRSVEERKAALGELQKMVPSYHGSISEEGRLINDNITALEQYREKLLGAAKAQAVFTEYTENYKKRREIVRELKENGVKGTNGQELNADDPLSISAQDIAKDGGWAYNVMVDVANEKLQELRELTYEGIKLEKEINAIDLSFDESNKPKTNNKPEGMVKAESLDLQEIEHLVKAIWDSTLPVDDTIARLENRLKQVREAMRNTNDMTYFKTLQEDAERLEETIKNFGELDPFGKMKDGLADMAAEMQNFVDQGQDMGIDKTGKDTQKAWGSAAAAVNNLGSALQGLDDPSAKIAGIVGQAVANIALGFAQAAASPATGAAGVFGWIAAATAGLATMVSTIASIKSATKFAEGGVVGGSTYSGDVKMARINSGEMVINQTDQRALYDAIHGGALMFGNGSMEMKVRGKNLVAVQRNYNRAR